MQTVSFPIRVEDSFSFILPFHHKFKWAQRLNIPTVDANSAPSQAGAPVIYIHTHRLTDWPFIICIFLRCLVVVCFPSSSSVDHHHTYRNESYSTFHMVNTCLLLKISKPTPALFLFIFPPSKHPKARPSYLSFSFSYSIWWGLVPSLVCQRKSFLTSLPSALGLLVSDYLFKLISRLTSFRGSQEDAEEEKSRAHMPPVRAPNLRIYWFKNGSNSWCCSALLRTYLFLSLAVRKTEIKTRRVIWNYCGAHFSSFSLLVTSFALALQWWRPSGFVVPRYTS